jgi:hypothetical protein
MEATAMTVIPFERIQKQELNYQCSECGAERGCNCSAPAVLKAAIALAANPQKSDRAIAAEIGVSDKTVGKARKAGAESSAPEDVRIGRDGKSYSAKTKTKNKPSPPPQPRQKSAASSEEKLATYKHRIAELEREQKLLQRKAEQERADLRRKIEVLEAENKTLKNENATLQMVAKEANQIAERAVKKTDGDAVKEANSKNAASVSNDFIHRQCLMAAGKAEVAPARGGGATKAADDGLDIPDFLRRDKGRAA